MDLAAVKEAPARELNRGAMAAARNARCLVEDAELLAREGRLARAYSLAGLAVEEVGKAGSLAILADMPENVRAQAPVGRMLEWHQMKLVAGNLIARVPLGVPGGSTRLASVPLGEIADVLDRAHVSAEDVDQLKQRGLYVDVDRSSHVREPSEVTAAEGREQLDRARRAARGASELLDPDSPAWLIHPCGDDVEFCRALVSTFGETRFGRSPEAAADVLWYTASKLHG